MSYDDEDAVFAENLASGLEHAGVAVFLDAWDIRAGESTVGRIDQAIRDATSAIVVVGHRRSGGHRVAEEYAALATRALKGELARFVPVLRDDEVVLPPLLDSWKGFSFAGVVDQGGFDALVADLVVELGVERGPRRAELSLVVPDDQARTPGTPLWTTLRVTSTTTTLVTGAARDRHASHRGEGPGLRHALWKMNRARAADGRTVRAGVEAGAGDGDLDAATRVFGAALADAFLPDGLAAALDARLADAARAGRTARLALEVAPDLADLPWESLVVAGEPVALRPGVEVYRHTPGLKATALTRVPGPLRILAVIASPDDTGADLLDHEHELARILDQVGAARREQAHVRVLNWGSVEAIRQALTEEAFHVLHVSCHARPGVLLLETPDGRVDEVSADRLAGHLVIAGRPVPLVVLAGCATALSAEALPGLARALIGLGVPSVLAMNASVTDEYATEFLARAYRELASSASPEPLVAVSTARYLLEAEHRAEWATPALHQRVRHNTLFEEVAPDRQRAPRKVLAHGVVDLAVGDFVGRRAELRSLLRALRDGARGVLVHGMGGVGKSCLAAELVHLLGAERELLVVTRHGPCTPDDVLKALHKAIRRRQGRQWAAEAMEELADPDEPWRERLDVLDEEILPRLDARVLVLLDDPLGDPLEVEGAPLPEPPELTAFTDAWLRLRTRAHLLITSRVPPAVADRRLVAHHLGPLSKAEAGKLMFRLPALDALPADAKLLAFRRLGGHPRALEYLDALLRGGGRRVPERGSGAQFENVVRRIDLALRHNGVADPDRWWRTEGTGLDLDGAVLTTLTITSADVLLDDLHAGLRRSFPLAAELLVAASVYRRPVDRQALGWVVAPDRRPDPERDLRLGRVYRALVAAEGRGAARSLADLELDGGTSAQVNRDLAAAVVPADRAGLDAACARLVDLTLLTPIDERFLVHRWTAASLAGRVVRDDLDEAHRRAAAYHRWQAGLWRSDVTVHLDELEEARHHSRSAGDTDQALATSAEMCAVLDRLGALDREMAVCADALRAIGHGDPRARLFHHRVSIVAMRRGDFDRAKDEQRTALRLARESADLVTEAAGLQQLGTIFQLEDDGAAAEDVYRRAVAVAGDDRIGEQLDARVVLASCYQRLGGLALARGDDAGAERCSVGALEVAAEVGDETVATTVHADLAGIAHALGDHAAGERHDLRAQEVASAHVDLRRVIAAAALQLGALCVRRRLFDEAWEHLRRALELAEEVDDLPQQATCLQLVGEALFALGRFSEAQAAYEQFVELASGLDDRRGEAIGHRELGRVLGVLGDVDAARDSLRTAMAKEPLLRGAFRLTLGEVLADAGLVDEATEVLREGADHTGGDLGMGFAIQLALIALRSDDLDGAALMFDRASRQAGELGSRRGEVVCLLALGLIARAREQVGRAVELFETALDVARGDGRLTAECLTRLADLDLEDGDWPNALKTYEHVLDVLDDVHAPQLLAEVLRQRGRCFAELGRADLAAASFGRAESAFARLGRSEDVLSCLVLLGWVLLTAGVGAAAADVVDRLALVADDLPRTPAVVVALLVAGDGALASGDLDAARDRYEEARKSAVHTGVRSLLVDCDRGLAEVSRTRGDDASAVRFLDAALAAARHLGDRVAAMHVHRELWLVGRDREHLVESAVLADELRERRSYLAVAAVLHGGADDVPEAAKADFDALLWLRRRRAVDGESAFGDRMVVRAGPSITEIVRELAPLPSGVSSVPAVVSPSLRWFRTGAPPRPAPRPPAGP